MSHITIAVPSASGYASLQTTRSIMHAILDLAPRGYNCDLQMVEGAVVHKARCTLLKKAILLGSRYMIFLDDDMVVAQGEFAKLLHEMEKGDLTGISALCAVRSLENFGFPVSWVNSDGMVDPVPDGTAFDQVHECKGFGLAVTIWDIPKVRKCLDNLGLDLDAECDNPFSDMPAGKRGKMLTEDLAFCRRIREGGGKLAIDCGVRPGHLISMELNAYIVLSQNEAVRRAMITPEMEAKAVEDKQKADTQAAKVAGEAQPA